MYEQLLVPKEVDQYDLFKEAFKSIGQNTKSVASIIGVNYNSFIRYVKKETRFHRVHLENLVKYLEKEGVDQNLIERIKKVDTREPFYNNT